MHNDSDRGINRVFLLLAAATENYRGNSDGLAINFGDTTAARSRNFHPVFRARQARRVIDHLRVSALQFDHLAKFSRAAPDRISFSASALPCPGVFATPPVCSIQPSSSRHKVRKSSGPLPRKISSTSTTSSAFPTLLPSG